MGKVVSQLLTEALGYRKSPVKTASDFEWFCQSMNALVDLSDKDSLYAILDKKIG